MPDANDKSATEGWSELTIIVSEEFVDLLTKAASYERWPLQDIKLISSKPLPPEAGMNFLEVVISASPEAMAAWQGEACEKISKEDYAENDIYYSCLCALQEDGVLPSDY